MQTDSHKRRQTHTKADRLTQTQTDSHKCRQTHINADRLTLMQTDSHKCRQTHTNTDWFTQIQTDSHKSRQIYTNAEDSHTCRQTHTNADSLTQKHTYRHRPARTMHTNSHTCTDSTQTYWRARTHIHAAMGQWLRGRTISFHWGFHCSKPKYEAHVSLHYAVLYPWNSQDGDTRSTAFSSIR